MRIPVAPAVVFITYIPVRNTSDYVCMYACITPADDAAFLLVVNQYDGIPITVYGIIQDAVFNLLDTSKCVAVNEEFS